LPLPYRGRYQQGFQDLLSRRRGTARWPQSGAGGRSWPIRYLQMLALHAHHAAAGRASNRGRPPPAPRVVWPGSPSGAL